MTEPRQTTVARISAAAQELATAESEQRLQDSYFSLSRHILLHRGCTEEALEPTEGTILYALFRKGQLTLQQLRAWHRFWSDLKRAAGRSGKLIGSYNGGVDGGGGEAREPKSAWNAEFLAVEHVWGYLRQHEKALIEQLIRDTWRKEGRRDVHAHDLKFLGGALSGYRDDRQQQAAGVSAVQRVLVSLAEIYGIQPTLE